MAAIAVATRISRARSAADPSRAFTSPTGEPLNPDTDNHKWMELLEAIGLLDGHPHGARHMRAPSC